MSFISYHNTTAITDLEYITQENINEAYINVTSKEIYREVQKYNAHVIQMRKNRLHFLRDMWLMIALNIIIIFGAGFKLLTGADASLFYRASGSLKGCIILEHLFVLAWGYLVLWRKHYSWTFTFFIFALLVIIHPMFVVTLITNVYIVNLMERIDRSIRDDVGYPHFVQINTSYIREEDFTEDGDMEEAVNKNAPKYSFDKYKLEDDGDEPLGIRDLFDDDDDDDDGEDILSEI